MTIGDHLDGWATSPYHTFYNVLSENLKSGLPVCLADGRLASFGPNEH